MCLMEQRPRNCTTCLRRQSCSALILIQATTGQRTVVPFSQRVAHWLLALQEHTLWLAVGTPSTTFPLPGDPEEPIHIVLEPDARNQTMLDEEVFPIGQSDGPLPFIGTFPNQAAATAALGGLTSAVYFDTTRAMTDQSLPMLRTTDGGATWNTLLLFSVILDALGVYPIIDSAFPLFASATSTNIAHPDEATAAATAVAANLDPTRTYFYYNRATSELMRVRPGIFARAPVMEIYYNIAAGGRLTGPDTLGDIHDYINTHLEGLTADYAGAGAADTDVTRPFANRSPFSGGSLNGLRVLLEPPLARGADGNNWIFNARTRFAGGAEVTERQAHVLIYTSTGRTGGIRITLDAGIQGLNEHGTPVDVSSGALGNEWTFATEAGTENTEAVIVSPTNREIIFRSNRLGLDETFASQLLNACNQGGTGCSATTFGGYGANNHVFRGRLGQINEESTGRNFHGGRDYHAATANPEPIAVTTGPTHAHTRLYTTVDGGILLSLIDPAHDGGNGFSFETVEGSPLAWAVVPTEERITLTLPTAGALASAILAAANAHEALAASYFGAETGTTNVLPARFGRHEMLGGLDEEEIEVTYAPVASGAIANPDTMGDVKAVIDAVLGLSSYYYGGADANTTANRETPWEHLFENGETDDIDLVSFGLGPEQNVFTGADRAAAEAARDTYAAANPSWVISYRGREELWISLRWGNMGAQVGQTLRATAQNPPVAGDWIDQALALKGAKGDKGDVGSAYADGVTITGTGALNDRFEIAQSILDRITRLEGFHRAPTRIYYFGWSDDRAIDSSDFANFNSSMTFEGTLPARNTNGYVVIAVPEDEGVPAELFIAGGSDAIDAYERQAGTVDDANGDPHIVLVSRDLQTYLFAGETVVIGY